MWMLYGTGENPVSSKYQRFARREYHVGYGENPVQEKALAVCKTSKNLMLAQHDIVTNS